MIKLFIAEDQRLVRRALAQLLSFESDFEVVGEASDGDEAIAGLRSTSVDIAMLDIEMPKISGLDVAQWIKREKSECRIIIVTTFARPGYIQRAISSGANGYLLKDAEFTELASAIRKVAAGGKVISPELVFSAWEFQNPLSPKEIDILRLATKGYSTKEIALKLHLSDGTIRNYLSDILSKLHVSSRYEAARLAHEQGWL